MKTIEQAAKEFRLENSPTEVLLGGFQAGVEFAQRWIPVDEELPELTTATNHNAVNVKYVTISGELRKCTAILEPITRHNFENSPVDFYWFVFPSIGIKLKTVTHWRKIELE